ncbi:MAG: hydroxymethylglutaryl-CoA lyase [Limnobacter sp.]|jgi:hydroxymethylglutaryl-CoA lyase|uniref:hydroxymethylglutaryl-CoA lyase n=2 Tax=unclassified Limnobacter TaxID=2630203 RepID=UPI000C3D00EA|nr:MULTISPECIES: hydroxymethylglutaryl-CoA lyase [unclassified Limnobacter]MAG82346.1 hydroxymethylglutaryl-CoA lyase [Sutterellaceae bacterium]MBT83616.1 hydroxymethylglutaryl-CoA lyase [Sutterellaceae bacterium]RZO93456.1 MAG: hydroxymethylglutaryl-CoA lyase [Limnobacter sp.]|tara:strand:+ start:1118 stop:2062 length:945 start_codon:yes stop_codon:yes gene_type:complete
MSMIKLPSQVTLVEVGPRDGLQNEKTPISTAIKVELCKQLIEAGIHRLEAAAFVSPKWVPQMADGADVLAGLRALPDIQDRTVSYSALVPNLKGMEAAIEAGVQEAVVFTAASEAFTQKNINCTIAESIERFKPVAALAQAHNIHLRGSISCALGCPYQGEVPVQSAAEVALRLRDIGVQEFDVADTIGVGTALRVSHVFEAVGYSVGLNNVAGHFHDTYGQALANILAALQLGVSTFHSSIAGLGGCPYAKGATGNVATEDVVYLLQGMGIETGLNLNKLVQTGAWISGSIGKPYISRAGRAVWNKLNAETSA